ncbi:MAG: PrsW family intramembrane metalloprotease [Candidatus Krumholzibacteria bacterium]|nr:PrsW family intramembrane metalloprotease [Candidatus Krumholzibacteria bacterium]
MRFLFSILPVVAFLLALKSLDSYKLVRFKAILLSLMVGFFVALAGFIINRSIMSASGIETISYSRYFAPVVEEFLKTLYLCYLIHSKKIGFMVDAAIFGFAIGAGFAIIENSYYLINLTGTNPLVIIIRGFGTAIMHGGTTAIFGIITRSLYDRFDASILKSYLPGFVIAVIIHSLFNHFFISPVATTLSIIIILPILMSIVFKQSEKSLAGWLGVGFDADAELLEMITSGTILDTHIGKYLLSLKDRFPGEIVADMLCLLQIHLELSIRAKGILLMKEAGFSAPPDPEIEEKFEEFRYLKNSIGSTGMLAMHPLLRWGSRELWQLNMIEKQ